MIYDDDYFEEQFAEDEQVRAYEQHCQHENDAAEECTRRMEAFAEWKQKMKIDALGY